jgi:hypothetical protein
MLPALGNDPEPENLGAGNGFIAVCAVSQHTRQFRHFSYPALVVFLFHFHREIHGTLLATVDIAETLLCRFLRRPTIRASWCSDRFAFGSPFGSRGGSDLR